jgi:spoIIIJ-associated protein
VEPNNRERRSVVASGKTVEDAAAIGLKMLGVRRDQVDIEVLNEGSRGVLGFGAENAQVRLWVKLPPKPKPAQPVAKPPQPAAQPPQPAPKPPQPKPEPVRSTPDKIEPETSSQAPAQAGREILQDILNLMGVKASVEMKLGYELAEEGEAPPPVLNITGDDLGVLIGRRGENLSALQYLVRLMVSHRLKHWTDLVVDVEEYRVRRHRALVSLAQRVAEQVAKTGRSQALEPMPAYERRLVHMALRNHPDVSTHSVGEGERRKVTVIPKR